MGVILVITVAGLLVARLTIVYAAPDLSDTWNFSTPQDYNLSSGLEISDGDAKLKAQNYSPDANTSALWHFDESGGTSLSDSSTNANNGTLYNSIFTAGNLNNAVIMNGSTSSITVPNSPSLQLGQQHTIEAWTKLNNSFSAGSSSQRQAIVDKGDYQLYYNNETGKVTYELADKNANSWSLAAGNDTNGSWDVNGKRAVNAQVKIGSNIYVGIGNDIGDAEVWKWDGSTWTLVGGGQGSVHNSWDANTYEGVYSLATDGTNLYAGLGVTAGDAEVWKWDGNSWTKIGGDTLNSGWTINYEQVWALEYFGGQLYAGIGNTRTEAEVWRWDGNTWSQIGGDGIAGSWNLDYEMVASLTNDGTNLYAGLGVTAGDAEVWKWNGSSWTKIGGDAVNGSWGATIETVRSLKYAGGSLYAGLGDSAGDAEVWKWNGSSWTKIGGDAVNGSWADATYEQVDSFAWGNGNLYAGLGISNGDGEVWEWNGSSWTKIGGNSLNGGWTTAQGDSVNTLMFDSGKLYAGTYDSGGDGLFYSYDGSSWSQIGGAYVNKSWGFYGMGSAQVMQAQGGYLYAGTGTATGSAEVFRFDGNSWQLIGGQGVNNSWVPFTYESVLSMASYKNKLYVGLGTTASGATADGEVWQWDGATWQKIGGNGLNSSWSQASHYGEIDSLAADNGYLYAGLGAGNGDAEVWRWDGSAWSQIGGDGINGSWTLHYDIYSLAFYGGKLTAGLGKGVGDGEVWQWNGSAWSQVGGDGINGSWATIRSVESLMPYNGKLYAGLGYTTGDGTLWSFDGSSWSQVGGDGINGSWIAGTYERVKSLAVYDGDLYVGLGSTTGDGEVWRLSNGNWSKIGGANLNGGWSSAVEEIESFSPYKGKLYVGTGTSANADNLIWSWGNNAYLESNKSSFSTDWHHIAATYNGSTMKLYIDGVLDSSSNTNVLLPASSNPLLIGTSYGGREYGKPIGTFSGQLDEIRISDIARTTFNSTPYSTTPQTISPVNSIRKNGVWHWDSFSPTQLPTGGTVSYQLSADGGVSWLYWDGSAWTTANSLQDANTSSVIGSNFSSFPVTFYGMKWQAVFTTDGTSRTALSGIDTEATSDNSPPSTNATSLSALRAKNGGSLAQGSWTNGASPYFTWQSAADGQSGILGYCAYLGIDSTADPVTTKGMLGNSPIPPGNTCSFIATGTDLDLATPGILSQPLTSSNTPYYLILRAVDKAGNIIAGSTQFSFKYDNTPPSNPSFITAPSGFINTKGVDLTWPISGVGAATDDNSGIAGLQYRIGASGQWYGDGHTGTGDMTDLLINDGMYSTQDPIDYDALTDGINTVYFRTWDKAGNFSPTYVTATLKINTDGAPSEPNNLEVTPTSNTANSFGFDWDAPTTYVGSESTITYCYTVNTTPSLSSCNYTAPGSSELTVGPYATQPGTNTLYVAARDESGNINFSNYASVDFTANTTAPGMPLNSDIVDVSIKNTSNWRLALTWDEPTTGSITSYRIYRSDDNVTFAKVGTSSSTTYIDAGLSQKIYYYKIAACDNTNNCGAFGATVSQLPTGKFTNPAALVSGPTVDSVTTKKATVSWSTDRNSDSKVALGTKSGTYSPSEIGNSDQVSAHEIMLDNLSPGTTYYYQVKWTDEDGNTGSSQEMTFTTSPAPVVKEASVDSIGLSNATINFTVRGATKARIYFGPSESFGGVKEVNTSEDESFYQVPITDLLDGTKYFYMISTIDKEGSEYRGNISSFTTPQRPRIAELRFQPVEGEPTSTQEVTWTTNVPSTSTVTYTLLNHDPMVIQDAKLVTSHSITIQDLVDDSQYSLVATSRDASGNLAISDRQSFHTSLDTRPPKISDIVVEPSIRGSGSESRGQIVVSWHTDELSSSQVAYTEGSDAKTFSNKTAEDTKLTTEHIIIISDLPTSKVYSVQPISRDKAQNVGSGDTQTAIIGRSSDSALTIVFNALKVIFGL
ncbi:MAG: LamG-like jellyroll fold domain-containing protein [Candidatus Saccharimonas sp.]